MRWTIATQTAICVACELVECVGFERPCCPLRQAYSAHNRQKNAAHRARKKWMAQSGIPLAAYGIENNFGERGEAETGLTRPPLGRVSGVAE